jgi:serine O-acetyltransferase
VASTEVHERNAEMTVRPSWTDTWADVRSDAARYASVGAAGSLATLRSVVLHAGLRATTGYRIARYFEQRRLHVAAALTRRVVSRRTASDVSYRAALGPGLRMPHPVGVVIGESVVVGANCTIMQSVTLGGNQGRQRGSLSMPVIGDGVFIGPGAVIVGPCVIADGVKVPANAVVTTDLPRPGSPDR